jgi:membrane protease YdiL (CAAX protease family)
LAPSPIAWSPEAWNIPLTAITLFGAVLVALIPQTIYLLVAIAVGAINRSHLSAIPADQIVIAQAVIYLPLGLYFVAVLPRLARTSLRQLGLRTFTSNDFVVAGIGTIVMIVGVSLTSELLGHFFHRQDTEAAVALLKQMRTPVEKTAFFVMACILAPMIEELAFRVFFFNALTRYFAGLGRAAIPLAAIVSGAFFGAVHASSRSELLTISIPLAVGGFVLAYVYALTRSYWASVTTHAAFNAIQVLALFFFHIS